MAEPPPWPDYVLGRQAERIGPALLELIDAEKDWVHRRVERIELPNAAQVTRSVAADITVPLTHAERIRFWAAPPVCDDEPVADVPSRLIVPLGLLPKAPLEDFSLTPTDAHRLTADQTETLLVRALAPLVRRGATNPKEALALLARIARDEDPTPKLVEEVEPLLAGPEDSVDPEAQPSPRLRRLARRLSTDYVLLVALDADAGLPLRVEYTHRQAIDIEPGDFGDPPLTINHPLPYASGDGPPYRIEIVAPDGLEIEAASIVDLVKKPPKPVWARNAASGEGAYVHLKAPDGPARPSVAGLNVTFGFMNGGIHQVAFVAGLVTTLALGLAVLLSYSLDATLKGSSASTLLAAPGLVTGLALGFATTRVTSQAVNKLRFTALCIALLGVLGGLTVALFGEIQSHLNLRHGLLIGLLTVSTLVLFSAPYAAFSRVRVEVEPAQVPSSEL